MSIQLLSGWNVVGGQYSDLITMATPLTIKQDGSKNTFVDVPSTQFYVFNDGKRRDPLFDPNYDIPSGGTSMALKYTGVTITPMSFSTVIAQGATGTNGTSNRLYLQTVQVSTPANMKMEIGTVLTLTDSATNTEDVLVKYVDTNYNYVDVIRNYNNSSTIAQPLNLVTGNRVAVSTKHIYLSLTPDFAGRSSSDKGGTALTLNDITNSISNPIVNPDPLLYQTIYIKAIPQLQLSGAVQITRIPTQHKTDVYFQIDYTELPN